MYPVVFRDKVYQLLFTNGKEAVSKTGEPSELDPLNFELLDVQSHESLAALEVKSAPIEDSAAGNLDLH
jgi:hypothetical protein